MEKIIHIVLLRRWLLPALLLLAQPVQATGVALQPMFGDEAFTQPVYMLQSPLQDDRWYVVERRGRIYQLKGDGSGD